MSESREGQAGPYSPGDQIFVEEEPVRPPYGADDQIRVDEEGVQWVTVNVPRSLMWNFVAVAADPEPGSDDDPGSDAERGDNADELSSTEAWLDSLDNHLLGDTDLATMDYTDDLRMIAEHADELARMQARLTEAIQVARARGRSWTEIALRLGVSRQAARQRYGDMFARR